MSKLTKTDVADLDKWIEQLKEKEEEKRKQEERRANIARKNCK